MEKTVGKYGEYGIISVKGISNAKAASRVHCADGMEIKLLRADVEDAREIHAMQKEAFRELLEKYQDFGTNPGNESVEKVEARLKQDFTYFYFICAGVKKAGAVRAVDRKEDGINKRISPIFILPEFGDRGIAQ